LRLPSEATQARALFLFLAKNKGFKNFAIKFKLFRNKASRFIAGETLDEAIWAVHEANQSGISNSLDLLGERFNECSCLNSALK
jgi:proline dehydrogenase